jgi:uncharacterized protein (TIGR03066 family)
MKKLIGSVLILTFLLASQLALAVPGKLPGKWKVVAIESEGKRTPTPPQVTFITEFAGGGKFIVKITAGDKTEQKTGTWKISGKTLTTLVEKKEDTMSFEVDGDKLKLTKADKPPRSMIMERMR